MLSVIVAKHKLSSHSFSDYLVLFFLIGFSSFTVAMFLVSTTLLSTEEVRRTQEQEEQEDIGLVWLGSPCVALRCVALSYCVAYSTAGSTSSTLHRACLHPDTLATLFPERHAGFFASWWGRAGKKRGHKASQSENLPATNVSLLLHSCDFGRSLRERIYTRPFPQLDTFFSTSQKAAERNAQPQCSTLRHNINTHRHKSNSSSFLLLLLLALPSQRTHSFVPLLAS